MFIGKALVSAALLAAAGLGTAASAQEIILYDGPNYTGQQVRVTGDVRNLQSMGFNDRASSFRVVRGEWELCQHDDYNGTCITHASDQPSLGRMNDQITSLRPAGRHPGGPGGGHPGREAITLYSGANYTGRSVTLTVAATDLRQYNFNDEARSIRHSGRRAWRVCQHANYGGACMQVDGDLPYIGGGMTAQISSAEPDYGSRPGHGGGNDRPRSGVFLYDGQNFSGQRVDISRDVDNLQSLGFNDRADSLIVARGETWVICEDDYMRGRCQRVEGEVRDLGQLGLRNRVTSLRQVDDRWDGGGRPGGGWGHGPRRGVMLYQGTNFSGQRVEIDTEVTDLRQYRFNDMAASIQIARGERWLVCEDSHFRGRCEEIGDDERDLGRYRLRNTISSLRPLGGPWNGGGGGWGGSRRDVVLYDAPGFNGRSIRIDDDVYNLQRYGFNDQAMSIEIPRGQRWLICEDSDFRGRCEEVSGDVSHLRGLSRQVSSLRRLDRY